MVILVVFNSFNVVKNLKKPDPVVRQMSPFYTTDIIAQSTVNLYSKLYKNKKEKNRKNKQLKIMFFFKLYGY